MPLFRLPLFFLAGALLLAGCGPGSAAPPQLEDPPLAAPEPPAAAIETAPETPAAPTAERLDPTRYADYEIITLLPPDAIPAVDDPTFLTAVAADGEYEPDELVIGVVFDGEARAYSVPFLSGHEIVNDTISGRKIAVTW